MPRFDYRCDRCSATHELELRLGDTPPGAWPCECEGTVWRLWSAPSIGRVNGGGGSPSRGPQQTPKGPA